MKQYTVSFSVRQMQIKTLSYCFTYHICKISKIQKYPGSVYWRKEHFILLYIKLFKAQFVLHQDKKCTYILTQELKFLGICLKEVFDYKMRSILSTINNR
jgi:hypothetical protein